MNEIFWIKGNSPPPLAVVLRPRGDDWLEDELLRMKRDGIRTLVSLWKRKKPAPSGLRKRVLWQRRSGCSFSPIPYLMFMFHLTQIPLGRSWLN